MTDSPERLTPNRPASLQKKSGPDWELGLAAFAFVGVFVLSGLSYAYDLPPCSWLNHLQVLWMGFHYRVYTILLGGVVFLVLWFVPKSLVSDVWNVVNAVRSWRDVPTSGSRTTLKILRRAKVALIAGTLGLASAAHIALSIAAPERYVIFSDYRPQSIFGFLMFLLLILAPGALVVCGGFLADLLPLHQRVVVTAIEPLVTEPVVRGLDAAIKEKSPQLYTELSVGERLLVEVTAGLREPVSVTKVI